VAELLSLVLTDLADSPSFSGFGGASPFVTISLPGCSDHPRPGSDADFHSYWTFPIRSANPDELVRKLWARGFDATCGAWSLYAVPAPPTSPS